MNRRELSKLISKKMDITQVDSLRFIKVWEETLGEILADDSDLTLNGFGTFVLWKQTMRPGRNPRNGEECIIQPRNSVKFKPSRELLESLNKSS